jgi:hypothetical protein
MSETPIPIKPNLAFAGKIDKTIMKIIDKEKLKKRIFCSCIY